MRSQISEKEWRRPYQKASSKVNYAKYHSLLFPLQRDIGFLFGF